MRFSPPLIPGHLVRRYKRFLADIELQSGEVVTAHCPNPGAMTGLADPKMAVWVSDSAKPSRKLRHTWELVDPGVSPGESPGVSPGGSLVGVHTGRANAIVAEALAAGRIPALAGYGEIRREVRYGHKSRIDFLLQGAGRPSCHLEVKSVTLKRGPEAAEFPDAVTARGARHLDELSEVAAGGGRAVMLFLVQRGDCRRLAIAGDIDPAYARAFERARAQHVEVLCFGCNIGPEAIQLGGRLPLANR